MQNIKLGKKPLTIIEMEKVREAIGLTQFDYGWLLGIDRGKYNRLMNNPDRQLGHSEAGMIRYLSRYFDDYPYHTIITPKSSGRASFLLNEIRNACETLQPVLFGEPINPQHYGSMGALLFRSAAVARDYDQDEFDMTLTGARWATLLVHCFQTGESDRIIKIIEEEALAHQLKPSALLKKGWGSTRHQ